MKPTRPLPLAIVLAPFIGVAGNDNLSPHQRVILDSETLPPFDLTFGFDAPAGTQFAETDKEAQRGRGKEVMPMARKAFDAGAESVTISPGAFRFSTGTWDKDGPLFALDFRGMKRDATSP